MPAIVCAAGHGKVLDWRASKLADYIGDKPTVVRVVENIKAARVFSPVVVVINPILGERIKKQLKAAGHDDVVYAYQFERRGAANAALAGIQLLDTLLGSESYGSVKVMFGEMPLVQAETLNELGQAHFEHQPNLTLLTCPHDTRHPLAKQLEKYTYLKSGWDNGHRTEPFLYMYRPEPADDGDDIIGSVYCFNRQWYLDHYGEIEAINTKHDGFGPEYHLPKLVELAVRQGYSYHQVKKHNAHWQILGYNTLEDYNVIARVYEQMLQTQAA